MPIDCHVKIEGVESESTHEGHEKEIDCLSWNWGVTNPSTLGGGGNSQSRGRGIPSDFSFTHRYDKASPIIAKKCAKGEHFPTVVITARQSGGGQKEFLKITLSEAKITSASPSASSGGEIVEMVSLSANKVEWDYKPMDNAGNLGGSVKFTWNVAAETVE